MRPPSLPGHSPLAAAIATMLVVALARSTFADSRPSPATFKSLIDGSTLVIVVTVGQVGPAETTLEIDRVLKGPATSPLVLPTRETNVDLSSGERAVVAFRTLDLDPRGGTIVWEIGPNGDLDPMHFQQYPGLPATLGELLTEFGIDQGSPSPEASSSSGDAPSRPGGSIDEWSAAAAALGVLVLGSFLVALVRWPSGTTRRR